MLLGGCGLAEVPGIDAGGFAGAKHITPQLSRGRQRPRDQCGVMEIRLRTRCFYSFLPQEKLGFMDFWQLAINFAEAKGRRAGRLFKGTHAGVGKWGKKPLLPPLFACTVLSRVWTDALSAKTQQ